MVRNWLHYRQKRLRIELKMSILNQNMLGSMGRNKTRALFWEFSYARHFIRTIQQSEDEYTKAHDY